MQKFKISTVDFIKSILNSYSQVFFSNNKKFAFIILIVSFFDIRAGLSGLIAVLVANIASYLIGFNHSNIKNGYYGFNSLLVGLGAGVYYQLNVEFIFVLIFASLITLFITIVLEGVIGKYGLSYLSLSFLFGIWLVMLASRQFKSLEISERGVYMLNDMYNLGGLRMVRIYNWFNNLPLHPSLIIYFRSIGAIFFQNYMFAGIIIAFGILIYSRIALLLSLLGFFSAYFYYHFVGANFEELSYNYIGYNFILTAIAIGGIFLIPSKYSFLWVILLIPLTSILISSTSVIFSTYQLSIFSLPFNIIVLMFLYILKFREKNLTKPEVVNLQQFSPEKNLYIQLNNKDRFSNSVYVPVSLPFMGEWIITQAHDGEFTHKEDWKHAWDFEIANDKNITFKDNGNLNEDYFCYNKPIIAPAEGTVEIIVDNIEDNKIGELNTNENWGNVIIIKHTNQLYSKLCHIKLNSFKVKQGEHVNKGDVLAYCGNSGRSPEPHIHFQLQSTPYIGSKTLDYPIENYISISKNVFKLKSYDRPSKGELISNIRKTPVLFNAFNFIPGQNLSFKININNKVEKEVDWEVKTNIYNHSYIYCKLTDSKAYFFNNGNIHYFTHFEGKKNGLLFYFFLSSYKVLMGFYKDMVIKDIYSLHLLNNSFLIYIQDFFAPFVMFMKAEYTSENNFIDDHLNTGKIKLLSRTEISFASKITRTINYEIDINEKGIERLNIHFSNRLMKKIINK